MQVNSQLTATHPHFLESRHGIVVLRIYTLSVRGKIKVGAQKSYAFKISEQTRNTFITFMDILSSGH